MFKKWCKEIGQIFSVVSLGRPLGKDKLKYSQEMCTVDTLGCHIMCLPLDIVHQNAADITCWNVQCVQMHPRYFGYCLGRKGSTSSSHAKESVRVSVVVGLPPNGSDKRGESVLSFQLMGNSTTPD